MPSLINNFFLKGISFIFKPPFCFGSILKICVKGPDHLLGSHCLHSLLVAGARWPTWVELLLAALHPNRQTGIWNLGFRVFSAWWGLTHSHFAKSHYSNENANERKAEGNGSGWVACQKCFTGEGAMRRGGWAKLPRSFAEESRFLGALRCVARGQVWRKHIFIDVPIVTGSYSWYLNNSCRFWQLFPFHIYIRHFSLVTFLKTSGPGRWGRDARSRQAWVGHWLNPVKGSERCWKCESWKHKEETWLLGK